MLWPAERTRQTRQKRTHRTRFLYWCPRSCRTRTRAATSPGARQLEKRVGIESLRLETEGVIPRRIGPVRPLARDAEAATLAFAEDQSVHPRYTSFLEYFEALASKRMERMRDFC